MSPASSSSCCPGVTFRVASHGAEPVQIPSSLSSIPIGPSHSQQLRFLHSTKEYLKEGCIEVLAGSPFDPQISIPSYNGFIYGVLHAYNHHHNLFIRPDDVWLAIVIRFSRHVNDDPEAMRSFFVEHSGKKPLTVSGFGNLRTADYGGLSRTMADLLRLNLKSPEIADWILPSFSTTTPHDEIVGSVALMATVKSYFEYTFSLLCGIPAVTLAGTVQDWEEVHRRVVVLAGYGEACAIWSSFLQEITKKLVESRRGQIDEEFWSKICHYQRNASGPSYISGWITAFSVLDPGGKRGGLTNLGEPEARGRPHGEKTVVPEFPVIPINSVLPGYATVNVTVEDDGVKHKTLMFCGHMGYDIVDLGKGIAPKMLWAIALQKQDNDDPPSPSPVPAACS